YLCAWVDNEQQCNTPVLGKEFPAHLRMVHRVHITPASTCLWANCGVKLSSGSFARHVQEKHLDYRWACPKCNQLFTRRGTMEIHHADC
ncbi:hypothetical protein J3R82DRAFT_1698, partial [Butyriboletus roseoflavus]